MVKRTTIIVGGSIIEDIPTVTPSLRARLVPDVKPRTRKPLHTCEPPQHPTRCVRGGKKKKGCCGRSDVYECSELGEATAIECRSCEAWEPIPIVPAEALPTQPPTQ